MRRFWIPGLVLLGLLAGLPTSAIAQTRTTVSGTVAGSDAIPWAGGILQVRLNSPGGPTPSLTPCTGPAAQVGCQFQNPGPVTLQTAGTFAVPLWANASILPAGTTYTFTVTIAGTPLPLGTGPQVCTAGPLTIAGSTQVVTFAGCPALSNITGSGSGTVQPGAQYLIPLYPNSGSTTVVGPSNLSTDATKNNLNVPGDAAIAGPRPWLDVTNPTYGCKGDSSTDDTGCITAALAAGCATTTSVGGFAMHPIILFPPGIYRVAQPQNPSTSPIFTIPCTFLELRGFPGGNAAAGSGPASWIDVIAGASPNAAPVFLVQGTAASSITVRDLAVQGYNEAYWLRSTAGIRFFNAPMTVTGATGLADNTPLKISNTIEVWRENGSSANENGDATFTTPSTIYTNETPLGMEAPVVGDIHVDDVVDNAGAEQYIERVNAAGGSGNFTFKNVILEGCNNGFFAVTNTSGAFLGGVGPFDFENAQCADASTFGVGFLSINDAFSPSGTLYGVHMEHTAGQIPTILLTSGHIIGYSIDGCYANCNSSDIIDASGNAQGTGTTTEMSGGTDHLSDNSYYIVHPTAGLFYGISAPAMSDRWAPSGGKYASMGADANFGFLFGLGDSNAFNAGLRQTSIGTLDAQFANTLPPTGFSGAATTGGSLAAATYYAAVWSTTASNCATLNSSYTYSAGVVVGGANNAINFSWTVPIATLSTPSGYCLNIQTSPFVISSPASFYIYVAGAGTTTFGYTGQAQAANSSFDANAMQSAHRFTAFALGINTLSPLFDLDVAHTGAANPGVRAAGFVDTGISTGTSSICPNGTGGAFTTIGCSGGGMVYPSGTGIPEVTGGTSWGSTYNAGNTIPANFISTLNQNTTGTASNLSGSQTANFFYAAPNGSAGTASFRAVVAADIPTLNQNTTGNAATATNLASYPTLCAGSQFSQGLSSGSNNCGTPSGAGPGTGTQFDDAYWATTSTLGSQGSNVSGYIKTSVNGSQGTYQTPSLTDSANSPVTSASYPLACDSSTTIIDRNHTVRFQSGASTPVVPLSSASGCAGMVVGVIDDGAGSLVFSRTSPDTFSVYNGATASDAQTSFTLTNGQYATVNQAASGIWIVRITASSSAGVSSFTGDGNIITNSATTGAVTATIAGTSGGIPYFSSTSAWKSSALLPTGDFVLGGGAGNAPTATFSVVPIANGGTGTGSTLTGLVRGNASAMTAAELSGDVTTSGSNAATVVQIEGAAIPVSAFFAGTNASKQLVSNQPFVVNSQTATYQVLAADFTGCKTITVPSGTFTITLVASGSQPASGQCINVFNYGSGVVTIARSGQNINGGTTSITLNAASALAPTSASIVSDGTNYEATIDEGTVGTVTTVTNSDGTLTISPTTGAVVASIALGHVNTWSGAQTWSALGTFSGAGAASTPGLSVTGAPYTGGSATTNFPQFYMNDGVAPTSFSAAGTEFGINTPSGFAGNIFDAHINGGASIFNVTSAGLANFGTPSTVPTAGTGGGAVADACGTAPTITSGQGALYCNASNFMDLMTGTTDLGPAVAEASIVGANIVMKGIGTNPGASATSITDDTKNITTSEVVAAGNKVFLASDSTDSTSGSLQLITGLSFTLPTSKAANYSFHCALMYSQSSAAVVDEFGVGVTGTAPTNLSAMGVVYTAAAVHVAGNVSNLASTTPTLVVSFTPSAATTIFEATIDGTIEQPSNATPGVLGIYAFTTTGTDNLVVKRDSYCTVF